jgi:hypothetical protein
VKFNPAMVSEIHLSMRRARPEREAYDHPGMYEIIEDVLAALVATTGGTEIEVVEVPCAEQDDDWVPRSEFD